MAGKTNTLMEGVAESIGNYSHYDECEHNPDSFLYIPKLYFHLGASYSSYPELLQRVRNCCEQILNL